MRGFRMQLLVENYKNCEFLDLCELQKVMVKDDSIWSGK